MALKVDQHLHDFFLQMGDNSIVLGHRISEWCGHGPQLEQDIALANIALDHVGQARMYYQLAATVDEGKTEDSYPFTRDVTEFKNLLLLEHENVDFGYTMARSFYFDHFHLLLLEQIIQSDHTELSQIAAQAIKEVKYHVRYSSEWIKRLGDGTEESHKRISKALQDLYVFTGEFFKPSKADNYVLETFKIDINTLQDKWKDRISEILTEATLAMPISDWFQNGGKNGIHTEKLGFLLAEMQFMQRAYPEMEW